MSEQASHRFDRLATKASQIVLAILVCSLPVLIMAALSVPSGNSSVHDWLPEDRIERRQYDNFLEQFGNDQIALISWEGATVDSPEMERTTAALRAEIAKEDSLYTNVVTTRSALDELTSQPLNIPMEEALKRLTGTLVGTNGTACIVVQFSEHGIEHAEETIDELASLVESSTGLDASDVHLVGTLYEEVEVDRAGDRSLRTLVPPSTIAAIVVAILALGRVRESIVVFILAGLAQLSTVAILYFTGGEFSAVLIVLPTLAFMLTLSVAVHFVNYYRDAALEHSDSLGIRALRIGIWPTALASVTTVIGMSSLCTSGLEPVRLFGAYSAVSLIVATSLAIAIFPALSLLLMRMSQGRSSLPRARIGEWMVPFFEKRMPWMSRNCKLVNFAALLLTVGMTLGVLRLTASTKFDSMFPSDSPTLASMHWMEQNVGPIVSLEVLLDFDNSTDDLLTRLKLVGAIEEQLRDLDDIGGTISAATFAPDVSDGSSIGSTAKRAVIRAKLRQQFGPWQEAGLVYQDATQQRWRITCKLTSLGESGYSQVLQRIRGKVDDLLHEYEGADKPRSIVLTGITPLIDTTQRSLLSDLATSFLMAFGLITPIMMIVLRSFALGLVVMLPNVLPVAMVFGTMGWLGIPMDIAGILTASIALGISVDDTIHFVNWYTLSRRAGSTSASAILLAYQHCAAAMLETTLIACSAMLPFFFADFIPTQRFAILMATILSGAIVADLMLLPCLLLQFGSWLGGEKRSVAQSK